MAKVTIAAGAAGSDIVLSANNVFSVESGNVEFSSDTGTTYIAFSSSEKIVFSSGLTIKCRNTRSDPAIFSYMAI